MYLLMAIIDDPNKVPYILEGFLQMGIKGATIVDSIGMAHMMAEKVPIFSRFAALGVSERYNRTIFVLIDNEEEVDGAIEVIEHVVGVLTQPETGLVWIIPVERCVGLNKVYKNDFPEKETD